MGELDTGRRETGSRVLGSPTAPLGAVVTGEKRRRHVGYALVGLAAGTEEGVRGILIYLAIYLAMNVGTFACILCMRQKDQMVEGVQDLAGLSKSHPGMALLLAAFMFSLAGVPPLAGFFGKFYIFMAAINAHRAELRPRG